MKNSAKKFVKDFSMCFRKKKLTEIEAEHYAEKYGQRVYDCPLCGKKHLTSRKR